MKVEIKGIEQNPIVSDYARIRVVESQSSVGNYEIRFLKAGRCGLNTNVVKTSGELTSQNRNIDVLGRKLEFVEEIIRFVNCEAMRCAMNEKPNKALNLVSRWLDTYFEYGGNLDKDSIKTICKTIGEL